MTMRCGGAGARCAPDSEVGDAGWSGLVGERLHDRGAEPAFRVVVLDHQQPAGGDPRRIPQRVDVGGRI